ncbi:MAG: TIGR02147 family protein [Chitinivibrionales bacterium]|nr:TIGR02147 family protein [Chitinivibrionales bacterium]
MEPQRRPFHACVVTGLGREHPWFIADDTRKYTGYDGGSHARSTWIPRHSRELDAVTKRTALPNVFEYVSHLEYLRDWRIEAKKADPKISHQRIAMALGQPHARSLYGNLESGRKRISAEMARRLSAMMGHSRDERMYFEALVRYGQAETLQEKELYFEQLIRLNRTPHVLLSPSAYAYFKDWYNPVIRALLEVHPFKSNYRQLARCIFPPVSIEEVRGSIRLLKELRLITRDDDGCWRPTDKVLSVEGKAQSALVKSYQLRCLENAQRALVAGMEGRMRNVTMTLSLSKDALKLLDKKLSQFKLMARSIAHKDEGRAEIVYHMNISLFPHTQ